jgi:hypothetical protein
VEPYGLFNLGEAGQGHFSFVIRVAKEDCTSITIPAGTLFPARIVHKFFALNKNPVYFYYQTPEDTTFYKSADGTFVSLEKLREEKRTALQTLRMEKTDEEYFKEDAEIKLALSKAEKERDLAKPKDVSHLKELLKTDVRSTYAILDPEAKQEFWQDLVKSIKLDGKQIVEVLFFE